MILAPEILDAREAALANLVATYEAIGLSLEGAFRIDGEGYRGVLSPIRHGAGNFALGSSYISLPWWAGQVGHISICYQ